MREALLGNRQFTIGLRDFLVGARVGILPKEQTTQGIVVNVRVQIRCTAIKDLSDTLDYRFLETVVTRLVEKKHFPLLEELAEAICGQILQLPCCESIWVQIRKKRLQTYVELAWEKT